MPVYSFGKNSPLKFDITDEMAEAYNHVLDASIAAQIEYKELTGREWDPEDFLNLKCSDEDIKMRNAFASHFDTAVEQHGGIITEDVLEEDHLVKN